MARKYIYIFLISFISLSFVLPGPILAQDQRRPFILPLEGEVATGFREEYITPGGSTRRHTGIDILGDAGSRVFASANGLVSYTGISPTGGLTVVIRHNREIRTTYLNLAASYVSRGDQVSQGDTIGCLGSQDDISNKECHLHFGVIYLDSYLDPVELLELDYSCISRYLRLVYMADDFGVY